MNIEEYRRVEKLDYDEYCEYLKSKYGKCKFNYFTPRYIKNIKVTRTKEGLYAHHIYEDRAIMLCEPNCAKANPFEYQLANNIVYCDLLEHLYLHILICEKCIKEKFDFRLEIPGIGGVVNFIAPELNDIYSGFETKLGWQKNCHNKIINDKETYLKLVERFTYLYFVYPFATPGCLLTSYNEKYGLWSKANNEQIFEEIQEIEKEC